MPASQTYSIYTFLKYIILVCFWVKTWAQNKQTLTEYYAFVIT